MWVTDVMPHFTQRESEARGNYLCEIRCFSLTRQITTYRLQREVSVARGLAQQRNVAASHLGQNKESVGWLKALRALGWCESQPRIQSRNNLDCGTGTEFGGQTSKSIVLPD